MCAQPMKVGHWHQKSFSWVQNQGSYSTLEELEAECDQQLR